MYTHMHDTVTGVYYWDEITKITNKKLLVAGGRMLLDESGRPGN